MDYYKIFSELVFPVAVTTYLLINTTSKIEKLTDEVRGLREELRIFKATSSGKAKEDAND